MTEYTGRVSDLLSEARTSLPSYPYKAAVKVREAYDFLNEATRFAKIDPDWNRARDIYI